MRLRRLFAAGLSALMLASSPAVPAFAYPLGELTDDPEILVRMHCRLLHLGDIKTMKLNTLTLAQLSDNKAIAQHLDERTINRLYSDFGTYPDFGFAVGSRWRAFSRSERRAINELFWLTIDKQYQLSNTAPIPQLCPIRLLTTEKNNNSLYASTTLTKQARDPKEPPTFIRAMYRLERPSEKGKWRIADILIDGKSFVQQHKLAINNYITQNGIKNIDKYFGIEEE